MAPMRCVRLLVLLPREHPAVLCRTKELVSCSLMCFTRPRCEIDRGATLSLDSNSPFQDMCLSPTRVAPPASGENSTGQVVGRPFLTLWKVTSVALAKEPKDSQKVSSAS